jgi:hypothetical protein
MRHPLAAPLVLSLLLLGPHAGDVLAAEGGLVGVWRLESQNYEGGGSDLAPLDPPLRLEISRNAAGLELLLVRGELRLPWPALVTDDRVVPLTVLERREAPDGSRVRARWRADGLGDGRQSLEVEETLVAADEDLVEGTVRVRLFLDGEARGGYTLQRRFVAAGGGS